MVRADNRDALKELAKLEKAAAKIRATFFDRQDAAEARARLQPVLDQIAQLEAALVPCEQVKADLTAARARYRELTDAFVGELKFRCAVMSEDEKRALVLELFAQDVQAGLDAAVGEKRQELVRFVERIWDKYRVTLRNLRQERADLEARLQIHLQKLGYA